MTNVQILVQEMFQQLGDYLPKAFGALIVLVVGIIIAKVVSVGVTTLVRRLNLGSRWNKMTGRLGDAGQDETVAIGFGKGTFYLLLLLVFIAFFEALNLKIITGSISNLLLPISSFIPNIIGAGVLLLVAWIVAAVFRVVVVKGLTVANADERLTRLFNAAAKEEIKVTETAGNITFVLVFLLFLPGILGALSSTALDGILRPIQSLINKILTFVPNIIAAAVILLISWVIARLVRQLVISLFSSPAIDALGERIGLDLKKLSIPAGTVVYVLILIPALASALDALNMGAITAPISNMLNLILEKLPAIITAVVIVVTGMFLARLTRAFVTDISVSAGADKFSEKVGAEGLNISSLLGGLAYILILLPIVTSALDVLDLNSLTAPISNLLQTIMAKLPTILTAIILLIGGLIMARFIRSLIAEMLVQAGIDDFSARIGLGEQKLSVAVSSVIYFFAVVSIITAVLDILDLKSITDPISNMLHIVMATIPSIFSALLVLAAGLFGGRLLGRLVSQFLAGMGFDTIPAKLGVPKTIMPGLETDSSRPTPSAIVGKLILAGIMLFATIEASELLGFAVLSEMIARFTVFGGQLVISVVILAVGFFLANLAHKTIMENKLPNADLLATVARIAIIILSSAMALDEMGVAQEIINMTFGALLGAMAVAIAIAFGLGGRERAAQLLNDWRPKKKNP